MARYKALADELAKLTAKVGWFSSAKYPDGTPVAYIAAIQENGVAERSIPPRPFFAPTIAAETVKWQTLVGKGAKAALKGTTDAHGVLEVVGLQAAGDVRKTISLIQSPPLSLITLLARKHKKEQGKKAVGVEREAITGKTIGRFARAAKDPNVDVSGVSKKPLVDTSLMLATLTNTVERSS